jgi:hypothetical protein
MDASLLVGTASGLWEIGPAGSRPVDALVGQNITALARDASAPQTWAIVDGRSLWTRLGESAWRSVRAIDDRPATCLLPTGRGLVVGTEQAHLARLDGDRLRPIEAFERVEGRPTWYTPWGDPADVRSMAAGADVLYVNVHVGGVVRSRDGGDSWTPTLDIEADVHQVFADPAQRDVVLVASAVGLGISRDGGDSWQFLTAGLHAQYLRAVTVADGMVLVTASTGPSGQRAAIYRTPLDGGSPLERCRRGLPAWFRDNIDTGCLAARGRQVAFGTEDGQLFASPDRGASWELVAKGLPAVRSVTFA